MYSSKMESVIYFGGILDTNMMDAINRNTNINTNRNISTNIKTTIYVMAISLTLKTGWMLSERKCNP